jgi:hypothetical protein
MFMLGFDWILVGLVGFVLCAIVLDVLMPTSGVFLFSMLVLEFEYIW